jgi:hypothetical protein
MKKIHSDERAIGIGTSIVKFQVIASALTPKIVEESCPLMNSKIGDE